MGFNLVFKGLIMTHRRLTTWSLQYHWTNWLKW